MAIPTTELNFAKAVEYHYDKFPPSPLNYQRLIEPLAKATDAIARFDQMLKNMHNQEILIAPLRNQEAVISSRMEGTISTMDEILQYEADHDESDGSTDAPTTAPDDKTRTEVVETIQYQRALKMAQYRLEQGYPLSESLIKALHARLLSFGRGAEKSPGLYKTEQNYLVDRTKRNVLFTPIRPEQLIDGMENLFRYVEEDPQQILLKTAITHVEFEALHPFKDGNGRIGRMLITLMLWRAGVISAPYFYISGYLEEHKDEYIDYMRAVSKDNDWTGWCIFFLEAIERQAIANLKIAEKISDLYETMKDTFRELLASKWSVKALDFIFENPVFRNSRFTGQSGIPHAGANKFTKILLDNGLLIPVQEASGRRSALYRFEPLMEILRV
jgi:Fic family protein